MKKILLVIGVAASLQSCIPLAAGYVAGNMAANSNNSKMYVSKLMLQDELDNVGKIIKTDTIQGKAYLTINKAVVNLEIKDLQGNTVRNELFQILTKPSKQWETIHGKSNFMKSFLIRSMDTKREYVFKYYEKIHCYSYLIDRENKNQLFIRSVNRAI